MAASWRAFLKLCRKSVISLFLLVILGSLTLKNVDKRNGYILSDVSELFVAKSLSMETTQLSTSFRSKRTVITKEGNYLQSLRLLRFTRDVFFVNLVLLGGDVLQNPGPVRIQCFNCLNSLAWLTSCLTNRSQAVCVEDELSSPMPVFSGVPQGSILGPVLFILYINDLPSCIQFSNIMMYADDTVIYLSSTTTLDIELKLNLDLVNLSQWLHHNKLVLNMKKTEFMTFGTRQRLVRQKCDETDISLNGQSIKHTDTFKYLGVVLDDTLSFNDHVDYVRMKVSKILGMFSRIRPSLTLEAANRLYKAMVLPVLDYCDAVWHECGQGNSDKIERLQRRAARIIYYKAASNLSTDQIMTKLGLEPLYYRRRAHILRFVDECIANRVPRYLSNYFNVRNCDIHRHKTRNNNDLILERINLECTKRAFFYKGAKIVNNF